MNPGLGLAGAVVAALASTALALRAGARLPRPPWAEVPLVAVLGVLAAQWVAPVPEEQPVLVALSMVAWLGFLMVYPTGRAEPPWLAGIVVVACCLVVVPLVWPAWAQWSAACFIVAFGAGAAGQVWRYQRRSSVRERQATKWLLLGLIPAVGVFLGVGLISFLPATGEGVLTHPWYLAAATAGMWAVPLAATAGLVLGERGPVDRLVVAVVTITGATLLVAVAYVGVLSVGAEPGWATTAACLAVLPAAWMSHAAGSRLAYARGPERPLGRLAAALAHAATPEGVSQVVVTTTRDALNVTSVIIGVDGRPVASIGNPAACTEEELVSFQGEQVAVLAVEPRAGESRLSPRDRTILRSIAQTVAPALYGARSAQRATEAAEQLSAAREDERRRLHADLHDDLGPTLAGLGHIAAQPPAPWTPTRSARAPCWGASSPRLTPPPAASANSPTTYALPNWTGSAWKASSPNDYRRTGRGCVSPSTPPSATRRSTRPFKSPPCGSSRKPSPTCVATPSRGPAPSTSSSARTSW